MSNGRFGAHAGKCQKNVRKMSRGRLGPVADVQKMSKTCPEELLQVGNRVTQRIVFTCMELLKRLTIEIMPYGTWSGFLDIPTMFHMEHGRNHEVWTR